MPWKFREQPRMQEKTKRQSRSKASLVSVLRPQRLLRLGEYVSPIHTFSVRLYVTDVDELYTVPECHGELTIRDLKSRLELLVGIPINFQRLHYLDEADLCDDSTFKKNDIIPGGTLTMRIWSQDAWRRLVAAAAQGNIKKLHGLGATKTSLFSTAHADLLEPEERNKWLDHRAFVALFITVRRGHLEAVEFLLQNGADLRLRTPLGRTALHVAATAGKIGCIDILLRYGAKVNTEDSEGYNAVLLARLWGQKESERKLFRYQWKTRAAGRVRSSIKPKLNKDVVL